MPFLAGVTTGTGIITDERRDVMLSNNVRFVSFIPQVGVSPISRPLLEIGHSTIFF